MGTFRGNRSLGKAAYDALRRQQSVCNRVQPGATPCNPVQPFRAADETNPPPPPPDRQPRDDVDQMPRPLPPIAKLVVQTAAGQTCDAMQPHATPRDAVQPVSSSGKTNPPPPISESRQARPADALTPRQLAAARLVAAGHTLPDVARELKLNRSTVWRWTREPAFAAELQRLHRQWSIPAPAAAAAAAGRQERSRAAPRGFDPFAAFPRGTR